MRFSAVAFVVASALPSAFACLCERTAYGVSNNFEHLFKNYTEEFAQSALSADYTDQTDSVAWLINNGTECPHPVRYHPVHMIDNVRNLTLRCLSLEA
jgi:hypothetical protein